MKRFIIIVLSLITAISLTVLIFAIKFRIERQDWIITTAKITFIGLPDGIVFGTFTDYNGKVHSEYGMYIYGRFQSYFNPTPIESESYLGRTVRIMYNPSTIDLEGTNTIINEKGEAVTEHQRIEIESYDNWLQNAIVSGIVFGVSAISLVAIFVFKFKSNR